MQLHLAVDRLRGSAQVIEALTRGVGDEQARWKPAADEWSILEVVNHLADEEVEDFRLRLDLTLHRPGDAWPPIDPKGWARERRYNGRDLSESVERFMTRRDRSARWLEALYNPDWSRAYEHPQLGTITAGDLLVSWLGHDAIHIRQLTRLHREYVVRVLFEGHSPDYAGNW